MTSLTAETFPATTATSSNKRDSLWFHFTALDRPRDTTFLEKHHYFFSKKLFSPKAWFSQILGHVIRDAKLQSKPAHRATNTWTQPSNSLVLYRRLSGGKVMQVHFPSAALSLPIIFNHILRDQRQYLYVSVHIGYFQHITYIHRNNYNRKS